MVEKPDMLFSVETVKRQEALMKMLRFVTLGVTAIDKMGTENIRGTADVEGFGAKAREARLRGFEQRGSKHVGRRMLRMELPGGDLEDNQRGDIWML